ncbi:MAG: TonB-dependent receptor [Alphaproteobacteria bacterium]|nr:TonB-dependent receptor [Alphaproteobacteria bacterium]
MRKYLFVLASSLTFAAPALARDPAITVLASGLDAPVEASGQSISVIGSDEIASVQGPDIFRLLERLPGVTLARNGSLGGFTGLFVRGAGSQQVLVIVDGARLADAAAPSGGYDFGNLMTGFIGKVELLRGSNSVVWGSDAIGGVLALTTRDVIGIEGSIEYGARATIDGNVSGGFVAERSTLSLSAGYTKTDGFSSAASGVEPDRHRQYRLSGRGRLYLTDSLSLLANGRHAETRTQFDGFDFAPPYGLVDTSEYSKTRETSGRAGLNYESGLLTLEAAIAYYNIDRDTFDLRFGSEPGFAAQARQSRAEMKARYALATRLALDFGAEHEWSRYETTYDAAARAGITSAHALLGWQGERLHLAAGLRFDKHSRFGSKWTFGANGAFAIGGGWRLRASHGEGFKAPSLFQLYSDYGNPALLPERSRSYDFGVARGTRNDPLHLAVTAFRRDTRGLIDYVSCFSSSDALCGDGRFGFYANVGRARAQGVEVELGARITDSFHAQAAYTFLKARDRTEAGFNRDNDLARRPRHAVSVTVDWTTPLAALALGADLRMVSTSFDDAGNFTRIEGHATGTLRASLPVSDQIELFGRIENVTDEDYQTVAGYGTAGRSAFVGASARF